MPCPIRAEALKFALVGASGAALNLILFHALVDVGKLAPVIGSVACFLVAATSNYLVNHLWTFRSRLREERPSLARYSRFIAASLVGLGVNILVLQLILSAFPRASKLLAQAVGICCGALFNYVASDMIVFRASRSWEIRRMPSSTARAIAHLKGIWPLAIIAGLSFLAHVLISGNYGYFRDELYYIADGMHLQAGYVDQPALMGWLAAFLRIIAGDSLVSIHIVSAIVNALTIVATGLIVRELGGGITAQCLAAFAIAVAPVFMAMGSIFSMDAFDQLWWTLGSLILVRILRGGSRRLWLLFGAVLAIACLTKLTVLFYGIAVILALLVTPERRHFRSPWILAAAGIAFLGLVPYVAWNAMHGWPTVDFYRHYPYLKTGPLDFILGQIEMMNPLALPMVVAGVIYYFQRKNARFRVLGWIFVFAFSVILVLRGKPYFIAPIYPIAYSSGAISLMRFGMRLWHSWMKPAYIAALTIVGVFISPLVMPILPPELFQRTYGSLGRQIDSASASTGSGVFPQILGDRFGWTELATSVERVYAALSPEQKAQACVWTPNYGEASALLLLGSRGSLPPVISGHNNYFLWGPGNSSCKVVIAVARQPGEISWVYRRYTQVAEVARNRNPYCVPEENDLGIYVASNPLDPNFDIRSSWPKFKTFN